MIRKKSVSIEYCYVYGKIDIMYLNSDTEHNIDNRRKITPEASTKNLIFEKIKATSKPSKNVVRMEQVSA